MNKTFVFIIFLLATILVSASTPLFKDGRTQWKIQIPIGPASAEVRAANELQRCLEVIGKAKLEIVQSDVSPKEDTIVIGTTAYAPIKAQQKTLGIKGEKLDEELAVANINGTLYLVGNLPRAAFFATMWFLDSQLHCRWLWEGPSGEFLPWLKEYTIPANLKQYKKPDFRFRDQTLTCQHVHIATEKFLIYNYINVVHKLSDEYNLPRWFSGHIIGIGYSPCCALRRKDDFKKYPEYFALVNGKRESKNYSGCWSNPGFQKLLIERIKNIIREKKIDILNIYAADCRQRCECPGCTKNPEKKGRIFDLLKIISTELHKNFPNLIVCTLGYQEYNSAPQKTPIEGIDFIIQTLYDRCHIHSLFDENCKLNVDTVKWTDSWRHKGLRVGTYGYDFLTCDPGWLYQPVCNTLADYVRFAKSRNALYIKEEMPVKFVGNKECRVSIPDDTPYSQLVSQKRRLPYWVFARLVWDPEAEVKALITDFCCTVYGPEAGKEIAEYHIVMNNAWNKLNMHNRWWFKKETVVKQLYTPQRIAFAKQKLNEAGKIIQKINDPAKKKRALENLKAEYSAFADWEKLANALSATSRHLAVGKADSFADATTVTFTSSQNTHLPTTAKFYWSEQGLHIRVICNEPEMHSLAKGKLGHDIYNQHDTIELLFDNYQSDSYRHFCINVGGGRYDAIDSNSAWDGKWESKVTLNKDNWIVDLFFPADTINVKMKDSERFLLTITRNGKKDHENCGYPAAYYANTAGQMGAALTLKKKALNTVWIVRDKADKFTKDAFYRGIDFYKYGIATVAWNAKAVPDSKAMEEDYSNTDIFTILTYRNKLPLEFFTKKLAPAVKNGATVIFHLTGNYENPSFDKWFSDPELCVKVPYNLKFKKQKITEYINPDGLATNPYKLSKIFQRGNFCVNLKPMVPDRWTILAGRDFEQDGVLRPQIIATKYGKGRIVISGWLGNQAMANLVTVQMLANLFEFAKKL